MVNALDLVRGGTARAGEIAALLARAFQDDPMMRAVFPHADRRARMLPFLIGLNVRYGCRYGEVVATRELAGAAIWLPPDGVTMTLGRMLRAGMLAAPLRLTWTELRRLAAIQSYTARLHERVAPPPHWYLAQIGVEPSRQRQGIGSALLEPMLARLDASNLPCYLETSREANVAFYQRRGFRVMGEGAAYTGGPYVWAMLREPVSRGSPSPPANP